MSLDHVITECKGQVGFITLDRPQALNALNLPMVRRLTAVLLEWKNDPTVRAVAIRGSSKDGVFGHFCAGGDIRFFHQAGLAGDPAVDDFFTEEYTLNHLIHRYPKPYIAFMDGVVMGGGMGISQGASHRLVTERTKMAMPETQIGLFPDVGGGYFLSRCPGAAGEWLAMTGSVLDADQAVALGLADAKLEVTSLPAAWDALTELDWAGRAPLEPWIAMFSIAENGVFERQNAEIDTYFSFPTVLEIVQALECSVSPWAQQTASVLRQRSPLMLAVSLAQIRRGRGMSIADDLRMERDLVRHCLYPQHLGRSAVSSETLEGIRALVIDKDHNPRWNPARIEDVLPAMVEPFFVSPWPAQAHPLRHLV